MKYILPALAIIIFLSACNDTAVVDEHAAIAGHQWRYEDPVAIPVHIADAHRPYRIYLNLRHTPDYRYSNIFMLVHLRQPSGKDTTERIELTLAEPDGRWLGNGTGSIYAHQQLIKGHFLFPDTGAYVFTIEQNMRENPLPEITDVGLRIVPVE